MQPRDHEEHIGACHTDWQRPCFLAVLIRVATYNVHGCAGTDGRFDVPRIAEVLGELGADVILLQEVGDRIDRDPTLNQAATVAERLGMSHVIGATMPTGPWGYGNVVLSRLPILATRRHDLSVDGREPRGCLRVDLTVDGEGSATLSVVAIHLGLAWGERRKQIDQLLGPDGPVGEQVPRRLVIGGDFNDWPPGPATRLLGRTLTDAAWPTLDFRGTFPSRFPFLRLDRLYCAGQLRVAGYRVHRSSLAGVASDHLPVVAEYELDVAA